MSDGRIELRGERRVGYADYGAPEHAAVLWCHGGPGSRLEPQGLAQAARDAGLRLIGVDRPGYGESTPLPGRSIADWVPDALAVLDPLRIARCAVVGVSTGGAYALALALATELFGADGSKLLTQAAGPELPAADLALLADPAWLAGMVAGLRAMFAHGVQGTPTTAWPTARAGAASTCRASPAP